MKDYRDLSNENILRLQAVRYFWFIGSFF
jgi:hypothetical protein